MRKNKTNYYFIAILLTHILVYFFKIDRDVFAIEEFYTRPNQTYTEQPYTKKKSSFGDIISLLSQFYILRDLNKNSSENIKIWNSISHAYDLRVFNLLKINEVHILPSISLVSISYRQNITHKSSEDEDLKS